MDDDGRRKGKKQRLPERYLMGRRRVQLDENYERFIFQLQGAREALGDRFLDSKHRNKFKFDIGRPA